jgi:hypothetical protein
VGDIARSHKPQPLPTIDGCIGKYHIKGVKRTRRKTERGPQNTRHPTTVIISPLERLRLTMTVKRFLDYCKEIFDSRVANTADTWKSNRAAIAHPAAQWIYQHNHNMIPNKSDRKLRCNIEIRKIMLIIEITPARWPASRTDVV